jgi:Protein of unknown function (DUF3592)
MKFTLVDHQEIEKLSTAQRYGWGAFLIGITLFLIHALWPVVGIIFDRVLLERRLQTTGITVTGRITEMRYYTPDPGTKNPQRFIGYYPDVSYVVGSTTHVLKAGKPGPIDQAQKNSYIGREVQVRYLPDLPKQAILPQWHESEFKTWFPVVALMLFVLLLMTYLCYVTWPKKK